MRHHRLDDVVDLLHAVLDVQHRDEGAPAVVQHLRPGNLLGVGGAARVRDHVQVHQYAGRVLEEALEQHLVLALQQRRLLRVNHEQVVGRRVRVRLVPAALVPAAPRTHHGATIVVGRRRRWRAVIAQAARAEEVGQVVDVGIEDEQESAEKYEQQQDLVH